MSRAGIFMDRDGTVSQEVGYMVHLDRYAMLPRSAEAIRKMNEAGFGTFVATNQSGVARGFFTLNDAERVNDAVQAQLVGLGAHIDAFYVCPHHPDFTGPCDCRKPATGMLERAIDVTLTHRQTG